MSKTKILFFASNPQNTRTLGLDEEARSIDKKIREAEFRDSLEFATSLAVRPTDLLDQLNRQKPTIVHFSGHGAGEDGLILTDNSGEPKSVSTEALKELFSVVKGNIRLVVLNACFSEVQGRAISEVIDCVVGMSRKIGDIAAITFAAYFYSALGYGRSVKDAFKEGRAALMLERIPEENTPVLLVREGIDAGSLCLIDDLDNIKKALSTFENEIEENPAVREAACLSKEKIKDTSHQISEMGLFKTVHDALHTIEHECLLPMKKDGKVEPRYKREFDRQSLRIQEAIKGLERNPLVEDLFEQLLDRLKLTAEDFKIVVNLPENAGASEKSDAIKKVVSKLDELLSGLPARFDTSIYEAARMLNLDRLMELLTEVKGTLSLTANGQKLKHELLFQGINDLKRFQEELIMRVKEHNRLQILDEKLRTVCVGETAQSERDLKAEWNRIKEVRSKLKAPFSPELDDEEEELVAAERDVDKAIERRDEDNIKDQLNEYFRHVSKVFRKVDSGFKFFCGKLKQLSEPLKTVLSKC